MGTYGLKENSYFRHFDRRGKSINSVISIYKRFLALLEMTVRQDLFKHYLYISHLKFLHHPYYQSIRQFVVVGAGEEGLEKLVHLDFFKDGLDIPSLQCLCMFLCPEIKED